MVDSKGMEVVFAKNDKVEWDSTRAQCRIRVAVLLATMNRAATAVNCVRALAQQIVAPVWVIVADNVSSDDTVVQLQGMESLPFMLHVHRMSSNRGNAGGIEEAMALGMEWGADAFWILDDDSWPRPEALANLLIDFDPQTTVRNPLQVDPQTRQFTWPLALVQPGKGWKMVFDPEQLPEGKTWESRPSWTGALVSRLMVERAGPVLGDLFIRGEDEEYSWRLARAGFRFELVRDAILDHPGPASLKHVSWGGKYFFWEEGLSPWKLYYKIRNAVWMKRRDGALVAVLLLPLMQLMVLILVDHHRDVRQQCLCWHAVLLAVSHGWSGRLGRLKRQWAP